MVVVDKVRTDLARHAQAIAGGGLRCKRKVLLTGWGLGEKLPAQFHVIRESASCQHNTLCRFEDVAALFALHLHAGNPGIRFNEL